MSQAVHRGAVTTQRQARPWAGTRDTHLCRLRANLESGSLSQSTAKGVLFL